MYPRVCNAPAILHAGNTVASYFHDQALVTLTQQKCTTLSTNLAYDPYNYPLTPCASLSLATYWRYRNSFQPQ